MRVVLYMRMSTDKQENSLDSQQNVLESYAKSHKMQITDKYVDEGISGRTVEKRLAFIKMIEDSAKDNFDAVLVYDSSRFARNLEESIVYKSILSKNNVKLISTTEPSLDDDSALITDAMLGALNEMYSRKLSKSVKRGMVHAAQKGEYQTQPPFGYVKSNKVLSIVEDEANVVKSIFDMFIECPSWHSVAVKLNNLGIKKRKAYGWYARDIKRMLQNSAYIGNVNYCGEIYKGNHSPIIDIDTWGKVQGIIENKPKGKKRPPSTYKHWLSGLLKCAHCGGRMNFVTDSRGNTSYRCSKHANGACKYSNFMSVSKLEQLVKVSLEMLISQNNLAEYEYFSPRIKNPKEVELLQLSIRKIQLKLQRHKAAYSNGIDSLQEYKESKDKCKKEEIELLKQIELLADKESPDKKIELLKKASTELNVLLFSDEYNTEQKSMAIKNIVDKIELNKYAGEFKVYYFL